MLSTRTQQCVALIACLSLAGGAGCALSEIRAIPPDDNAPGMSDSPVIGRDDAGPADPGEGEEPGEEEPDAAVGEPIEVDAGEDAGNEEDPCLDDPLACLEVPADCVGQSFGSHAYLFCTSKQYWGEARATCQGVGLDLVVIESAEENSFVASHLSAASWIGAHDRYTEGSFRWVEPGRSEAGASVSFTSWASLKPDNCAGGVIGQQDCVRMSDDGKWDDSACDGGCFEDKFAFVCESY